LGLNFILKKIHEICPHRLLGLSTKQGSKSLDLGWALMKERGTPGSNCMCCYENQ
jgi:hypothetical protein